MSRNWTDLGIVWESSPVSERIGSNDTSKVVIGLAEIPQLSDVAKAIDAGLSDAILAGCNGTSWRVSAQDVGRSFLKADGKRMADGTYKITDEQREALRERVFNRIKGLRSPGGSRTVTVTVHNLPNGTVFNGSDETEYRQAFAATLIDMGVPSDAARAAAMSAKW